MSKNEFIQRVREFISLTQSVSANDYEKIITPELNKLKAIALVEGFDFDEIYKKASSVSRKLGMRDKTVSHLRPIITNPLTEELCEAMLDQFVNTGAFNIRKLELQDSIQRGSDQIDTTVRKSAELASLEVGLTIFVDNIRNGYLDKVNTYYYEKIKSIGLEYLERYLQTGESTPELNEFLREVYAKCYDYSMECIGDAKMENSIHAYPNQPPQHMFRLYFNMPQNNETVKFIRDYQIACQKQGIEYCMKAFFNTNSASKDVTVFYSSYKDISLRLEIIKELFERYPNLELGTPPLACARISGLDNVGLGHNGIMVDYDGIKRNMSTYNDYIDNLSYLAFVYTFGTCLSSLSSTIADKIEKIKNGEIRGGGYRTD